MTRINRGVELTPETPLTDITKLAEQAESVGFDTVFTSSHYFNRDPFVALGKIAESTDDVYLGPAVVNPYEAHPVGLASRAATIQEVSNSRAVFGIGAGDASTLRALGVERARPLERVLEAVQMSRSLWDGEAVDDGKFVNVDGAKLAYEVDPLPVYVGAQGPDMLRMAAKHADGVLFNASHPADVAWAVDRIAEGATERPVERREFDFVVQASVSIARKESAARETARQAAAVIAGGASRPVLDRHGIDHRLAGEIGTLVQAGNFRAAFDMVSDRMIDAFCVAGESATVSERFENILAKADGVVAATPLGPNRDDAIDMLAEVIPA